MGNKRRQVGREIVILPSGCSSGPMDRREFGRRPIFWTVTRRRGTDAFKRSAMAIRAHRPITVVRILDRIDHLLLSIDQLQMIAAMAEFAGKISDHRKFLSV